MSAVIYAAIVVMWAVVLVPMWLRRHDAATESRSVDRFSTAMRTLSRRTTSSPGRRYVVMPRRSEGGVSVHVSGASSVPAEKPVARTAAAAASTARVPRRRTSIVARRRRLLLGMLVVTFLTMVLAAAGVISWPLQIVVDVVLVAFCIHLRAQVKRAAATSRQRQGAAARQRSRAAVAPGARPAARPSVGRPAPAHPMAPQSQPQPAAAIADEALEATGTDDDTWEPVPVPRPTYTLKPPAPVEVPAEAIDPLRDTDPYNAMAAVYDEPVAPGSDYIAVDGDEVESDLDEILTRRWAVND